jgi:hypothetical protein
MGCCWRAVQAGAGLVFRGRRARAGSARRLPARWWQAGLVGEQPLPGGFVTTVVRAGNTVRRAPPVAEIEAETPAVDRQGDQDRCGHARRQPCGPPGAPQGPAARATCGRRRRPFVGPRRPARCGNGHRTGARGRRSARGAPEVGSARRDTPASRTDGGVAPGRVCPGATPPPGSVIIEMSRPVPPRRDCLTGPAGTADTGR